jgi:hypothetical protein
MNTELYSIILDDLEKRDANVIAFVIETADGLQLISYKNGVVNFLSEAVSDMEFNARLEGNLIRPIARIGKKNGK